jgi:Glycosyl transferases group 1
VVVPPPVTRSGPLVWKRERLAVAYTPDVKAKGLDIVCGAWAAAKLADARLRVFGVERETALGHLERTGTPVAASVEFAGLRPAEEFRAALRHAWAYAGGARWEDFGQAPLEALADGALLATVPSGGPFEALGLARRLAGDLVAPTLDTAGLAGALRRAFEMPDAEARAYRDRAATMLKPFDPGAIQRVIEQDVLPALLNPGGARPR